MSTPDSLSERMARAAFEKPAIAEQWQFYLRMFGPILTPAWPDSCTARIHLINILNHIGRKEADQARKLMATLERSCGIPGDPERALMHFLAGLLASRMDDNAAALTAWCACARYNPPFAMPSFKAAVLAREEGRYALAADMYRRTLMLPPEAAGQAPGALQIPAESWCGLALCLTMLRLFPEAQQALAVARSQAIVPPSLHVAEAFFCAATGREEEVRRILQQLSAKHPQMARGIASQTDDILRGVHPHFSLCPADDAAIRSVAAQWPSILPALAAQIASGNGQQAAQQLHDLLAPCFPFEHKRPLPQLTLEGDLLHITLRDMHSLSLTAGYDALTQALPGGPFRLHTDH